MLNAGTSKPRNIHVSEPWFTHFKNGLKKFEGRRYTPLVAKWKLGDLVCIKPVKLMREKYRISSDKINRDVIDGKENQSLLITEKNKDLIDDGKSVMCKNDIKSGKNNNVYDHENKTNIGNKNLNDQDIKDDYKNIKDDNQDIKDESLLLGVKQIIKFSTFEEALQSLPVKDILPGVDSIGEGVEVYKKFVSIETQLRDGVVMIELGIPD